MKKKYWMALIIIIAILISLITSINLAALLTYDEYQSSLEFYYEPENPVDDINLKVKSDKSSVLVKPHFNERNSKVIITIDFNFSGPFLAGKTYEDFFQEIFWSNSSNDLEFSLKKLPDVEVGQLNFNSTITIYLANDILYNIDIKTSSGNINSAFLDDFIVGRYNVSSTTGNITLCSKETTFLDSITAISIDGKIDIDLLKCTLSSDMTLRSTNGEIRVTCSNLLSNTDCNWGIFSEQGDILLDLFQFSDIGINVVGEITSYSGTIDIKYFDMSDKVGAKFTADTSTGAISFLDDDSFFLQVAIGSIKVFTSFDYDRANYTYNLLIVTFNAPIIIKVNSTI